MSPNYGVMNHFKDKRNYFKEPLENHIVIVSGFEPVTSRVVFDIIIHKKFH